MNNNFFELTQPAQPMKPNDYPPGDIRKLGNVIQFRKKFEENYKKAQQAKSDFQVYQQEMNVFGRQLSK